MQMLLGGACGEIVRTPERPKERKPFELPCAGSNMRRAIAYLVKERHIDEDVVRHFVNEHTIFEDAQYHNVVFVGMDGQGQPRHAHKRSTQSGSSYKCNASGSQPEYSFHHIGTGNRLYVFEAPIDMLSFISLYPDCWQEDSYVALCSVSPKAVLHQLRTNPHINCISLCLDSDTAGVEGSKRIAEHIKMLGDYHVECLLPSHKDWNEELCAASAMQVEQRM